MNCLHCTAPTDGVTLCGSCRTTATVALVNVAAYHSDVLRIQPGQRVKVRSAYQSTPPPAVTDARDPISDAADRVAIEIFGWCRALLDDRPMLTAMPTETAMRCAWLERNLGSIVTLDWAGEMLRQVMACEKALLKILDKSDTGWYAGKCGAVLEDARIHDQSTCGCDCHVSGVCDLPGGCGSDVAMIDAVVCERPLYGTSASYVRCPECGTVHNSEQRRENLMAEARDEVAPVAVIAKAVVGLLDTEQSVQRLSARIDQWVSRGQLKDLGVRVMPGYRKPARVYRIGDVFDLLQPRGETKEAEAC